MTTEIHACTFCGAGHGSDLFAYRETACEAGMQSRRGGPAGLSHRITQESHAFELVDALFGVSRPDLSEGLILVSSGFHVLRVDHVVDRFLGLVPSIGQLGA